MAETTLTTQQHFEQKIIDKLRADVGDLMSDEMLSDVVRKAMDKIFFDPVVIRNIYGSEQSRAPSWLEQEVKTLVGDRVGAAIKAYFEAHPDELKNAIDAAIGKGLAEALARALTLIIDSATQPVQEQLYKALQPKY